MPLYQPRNMQPSSFSQSNTIDATKEGGNIFSCELDGNVSLNAYRLLIRKNNTTSDIVYDSGKVVDSTELVKFPFYPRNSNGSKNIFQVNVPKDFNTPTIRITSYTKINDTTVQATTAIPHGFSDGDTIVQVSDETMSGYNGYYVIKVTGINLFTFSETSFSAYTYNSCYQYINRKDPYKWQLQIWANASQEIPDVKSYEELFYANDAPQAIITSSTQYPISNFLNFSIWSMTVLTMNGGESTYPHGLSTGDKVMQVTTSGKYDGIYAVEVGGYDWKYGIKELSQGDTDGYFYKNEVSETGFISKKSHTFRGVYHQRQDIPIQCYGWILKDISLNEVLVDTITKNSTYGSADNIELFYDGFFNGVKYSIQLMVQNQNGASVLTDPIEFTVAYNAQPIDGYFSATNIESQSAIKCEWDTKLIEGVAFPENAISETDYILDFPVSVNEGEYRISSLNLKQGISVVFDTVASSGLNIDINSTHMWAGQVLKNETTMLYRASGSTDEGLNYVLELLYVPTGVNIGKFVYNQNGVIKESLAVFEPYEWNWYVIIMDNNLEITHWEKVNGLTPSVSLTPTATLTPLDGVWDIPSTTLITS